MPIQPGDNLRFAEKLNHEQTLFMLRLFAEGCTQGEVAKEVFDQYGIECHPKSLWQKSKSKKWQPYYDRFREDYLARVKAVPIAHKRIRIDDLEKSRQKLLEMIDKGNIDSKQSRNEMLMIIRRLNETICVAREEMENKPQMIQQVSVGAFSSLSDEELQKRKEMLIAKATGTHQARDIGVGESDEGAEVAGRTESS